MAAKYGPPDLTVKSPPWTVPAEGQDAWWRPEVPTGLTEARWVRAIEIRPTSVEMRKVTHHALARLQQKEDATMPKELFTNDPNVAGDGLFMEWAVGKNADEMRPDSGRLMLPGSKILWEMHYHSVGEEVKDAQVELAVWFYPKGQEPKHREVLALFNSFSSSVPGGRGLDIPPNADHDDRELRSASAERAHRELPGARAPARQGHVDGGALPGWPASDAQPGDGLQLQLDEHVHLRRRFGAAASEGHDPSPGRVVRQHERRTSRIRIRISGSAMATERWTRWATRGSTSPTTTTRSSRRRSPSARR